MNDIRLSNKTLIILDICRKTTSCFIVDFKQKITIHQLTTSNMSDNSAAIQKICQENNIITDHLILTGKTICATYKGLLERFPDSKIDIIQEIN